MKIAGKTALILGATRGVGRAIADSFAEAGTGVIYPYHDWPEACEETNTHLSTFPNTLAIRADLTDQNQVKAMFKKIATEYGKIHIVINNIERGGMPIVHGAYTPEQWDLEMNTTLKAKWLIFQESLPLMQKATQGVMVNISSIAGKVGRSGPAGLIFNDAYAAANQAISSFTKNWAQLAGPNIRVNELILGFIQSRHAQGTRGWELLSDEQQNAIIQRSIQKRTGTLSEVVKTVLFMVQDATFMTGSSICLDGGFLVGHDQVPPLPDQQDNLHIKLAK